MQHEQQLLLTVPEAARALRVSTVTIYRLIWSGQLRPVHIGRAVRIARAEVERFVREAQERELIPTRG